MPDDLALKFRRGESGTIHCSFPLDHDGGIAAYYASVSATDANFGVVLDALNASGYADNTIIVLLGDHGVGTCSCVHSLHAEAPCCSGSSVTWASLARRATLKGRPGAPL